VAAKQALSLVGIQKEQSSEQSPKVTSASSSSASSQLKSFLGIRSTVAASNVTSSNNNHNNYNNSAKAWSTPQTLDSNGKSLKEIMDEELVQRKTVEETTPELKHQTLSWASKAKASIGSNSTFPAQQIVHSTLLSNNLKRVNDSKANISIVEPPQKPIDVSKPLNPPNPVSVKTGKKDNHGKSVNNEMTEWCLSQLKKLGASEESALLDYCLQLTSPVEIRETLAANLGSTAQVIAYYLVFLYFELNYNCR
jgi:hypothetical protein